MKGIKLTVAIAAGVFLGILALLVFLFSGKTAGGWRYNRSIDPMTDVVSVEATVVAEGGQGRLALSCSQGQEYTRLFVGAPRRLTGFGDEEIVERMVKFRFDNGVVSDTVGSLIE
jgi:hypothetical protein